MVEARGQNPLPEKGRGPVERGPVSVSIMLPTFSELADLPGAGQLMSFVFSKDYLELKQKLGIAGVVQ